MTSGALRVGGGNAVTVRGLGFGGRGRASLKQSRVPGKRVLSALEDQGTCIWRVLMGGAKWLDGILRGSRRVSRRGDKRSLLSLSRTRRGVSSRHVSPRLTTSHHVSPRLTMHPINDRGLRIEHQRLLLDRGGWSQAGLADDAWREGTSLLGGFVCILF